MDNEITYMDCWHFVAPMIPVNTDYARSIYCMVFSALKEAYTLTHVCTKCGRKVVTKFPRYYLIGVKDNHE